MSQTIYCKYAYVLHSRNFRNSSLIVDFFTEEYGCISAIARAAKNIRTQMKKAMIQPFTPMTIHCRGKGELLSLVNIESCDVMQLNGNVIFCGLYINELLLRLLAKYDPYPDLFHHYKRLMSNLSLYPRPDQFLREFELQLLTELGYQLVLNETKSGETILADYYYQYSYAEGLTTLTRDIQGTQNRLTGNIFFGKQLLAMANGEWSDGTVLKDAKRLMRMAFSDLLGDKPLNSRKIYQEMMAQQR